MGLDGDGERENGPDPGDAMDPGEAGGVVMKRRQTSLPAWGSWFAALVLVAQVGFPGATAPGSGSLSGSGPSLSNLRSAQAEDTTSNGIAIVGPDAIQVRPADEDQANAFNAALELAYAHRDDLGYPWLDAASGVLELSFATGLGETVAASALDGLSRPPGERSVSGRLRPPSPSSMRSPMRSRGSMRLAFRGRIGSG